MYRGKVTAIDGNGIYVLVADLHPSEPFGPCQRVSDVEEGDLVLVADVSDLASTVDLVVIGVVQ